MLHGDLKGVSFAPPRKILTEQVADVFQAKFSHRWDGHARVSDFGLASIAHGKYSMGVESNNDHTVRWSAPEVLFGDIPASRQADIFAFGMAVVEVRTIIFAT
jgi:serine/threonine protein kinase